MSKVIKCFTVFLCITNLKFHVQGSSCENIISNKKKDTLLLAALNQCNLLVADWLVSNGEDVNQIDENGSTIMMKLSSTGGCYNYTNPIYDLAFLISKKADINAEDQNGKSALFYSAFDHFIKRFEFLLDNGSKYQKIDSNGQTVLHMAAQNGQCKIIELLIDKTYIHNVNVKDNNGHKAIYYAQLKNYTYCFQLLKNLEKISINGNSDVQKNDSMTVDSVPLQYNKETAAQSSPGYVNTNKVFDFNNKIATELMFLGNQSYFIPVIINNKNPTGQTLTHITIKYNFDENILKLLINLGIDLNVTDERNNLPVHYAANNVNLLKLILQNNIDINARNLDNKTALDLAIESRNMASVRCLIKYGADPRQVVKSYDQGDRYYSYVRNKKPNIITKTEIYNFLDDIINQKSEPKEIEC